jgi:hypothetical protein
MRFIPEHIEATPSGSFSKPFCRTIGSGEDREVLGVANLLAGDHRTT